MRSSVLYAYNKVNDTTETVTGKLNIISLDKQNKKVYLVPVNGPKEMPSPTKLQDTLDVMYAQAATHWVVEQLPGISVDFPGGNMTHGGSNDISVYNADQKKVIKAFKKQYTMENDALYLFFVDGVTRKSGDIAGYMPLQRQAGFIYGNPSMTLVAHELGHGAFNLRHTFSPEKFIAAQGSTQNLMDYKDGRELWQHQWRLVQDPENVWLAFLEDEEEGEGVTTGGQTICKLPDELIKLLPGESYYRVIQELTDKTFRTFFMKLPEGAKPEHILVHQPDKNQLPEVFLSSFKLNGKLYEDHYKMLLDGVIVSRNGQSSDTDNDATSTPVFTCKGADKINPEIVSTLPSGSILVSLQYKDNLVTWNGTNYSLEDCQVLQTADGGAGTGVISTHVVDHTNIPGFAFEKDMLESLYAGRDIFNDYQSLKTKLYLTSQFTSIEIYEQVRQKAKSEACLWMHQDKDGKWVLKKGFDFPDITDYLRKAGLAGVDTAVIYTYIRTEGGTLEEIATATYKITDWLCNTIHKKKIPEHWWNCDNENHAPPLLIKVAVKVISESMDPIKHLVIPTLGNTPEFKNLVEAEEHFANTPVALLCGLWDGVITLVETIPGSIKLVSMYWATGSADAQKEFGKMSFAIANEGGGVQGLFLMVCHGIADQFDSSKPCVLAHSIGEYGIIATAAILSGGTTAVGSTAAQTLQKSLQIIFRLDAMGVALGKGMELGMRVLAKTGGRYVVTIASKTATWVFEIIKIEGKQAWIYIKAGTESTIEWANAPVWLLTLPDNTVRAYRMSFGETFTKNTQKLMLKEKLLDNAGQPLRNADNDIIAVVGREGADDNVIVALREVDEVADEATGLADDVAESAGQVTTKIKTLAEKLQELSQRADFDKISAHLDGFTPETKLKFIDDLIDNPAFYKTMVENPEYMRLFQYHKKINTLLPEEFDQLRRIADDMMDSPADKSLLDKWANYSTETKELLERFNRAIDIENEALERIGQQYVLFSRRVTIDVVLPAGTKVPAGVKSMTVLPDGRVQITTVIDGVGIGKSDKFFFHEIKSTSVGAQADDLLTTQQGFLKKVLDGEIKGELIPRGDKAKVIFEGDMGKNVLEKADRMLHTEVINVVN